MTSFHISAQRSKHLHTKYSQLTLSCRKNKEMNILSIPLPSPKTLLEIPSLCNRSSSEKYWIYITFPSQQPQPNIVHVAVNALRKAKRPTKAAKHRAEVNLGILQWHSKGQGEKEIFKSSYNWNLTNSRNPGLQKQECQFLQWI